MAISPLRITRFPALHLLADEHPWPSTTSGEFKSKQICNSCERLAGASRIVDDESGIFLYEQTVECTSLSGVLARLDLENIHPTQLRIPLPPDAALTERDEQLLQTSSMQLSPVVALYDADPAAISCETAESETFRIPGGEIRIAKATDASVARIRETVSNLPLTVIDGQKWLGGRSAALLLVNRRICHPELLAVHRVISCGPDFRAGEIVRLGRDHFFFRDVTRLMPQRNGNGPHFDAATAAELLRPQSVGEIVMLAVSARHSFRIHSLPGWADTVLAHLPPEVRRLDSVQLHEILMPKAFGFGGTKPSKSAFVGYTVSMEEAVSSVERGASVAILMNLPSVDDICELPPGTHLPPEAFALRHPPLPGVFAYELA